MLVESGSNGSVDGSWVSMQCAQSGAALGVSRC